MNDFLMFLVSQELRQKVWKTYHILDQCLVDR